MVVFFLELLRGRVEVAAVQKRIRGFGGGLSRRASVVMTHPSAESL